MTRQTTSIGSRSKGQNRRRLLELLIMSGALAAGRTIPDSWVRPVVDQVMLPAHAQTSPEEDREEDEEDNGGMTQIDPPSLQLDP